MPESFDPYHAWLGIPKEDQPPNHYRLLGIPLLESSLTAIEHAADQRMTHLRTLQSGKHAKFSDKLLNEVAVARVCLLDPRKKAAYDKQLRENVIPKPPPPPTGYEETVLHDAKGASPGAKPATERRLGEYKLIERIGEGGMGTVYKALHTKLGREVALKVLPKGRIGNERAVARFEREMKAIGVLDHPNIVRATDAGNIRGTWFLVMELVEGLDLKEVVRRAGPLPIADACEIARQAALGLQCAHQHALVHRDVKPSNLMLTTAGQVKLLDLGLARFQAGHPAGDEMTATGQAIGTLDYMAPEQASNIHSVDIRADIYSLGCTLFKLLTGRAPFDDPRYDSTYKKMNAHVTQPPLSIARLRREIPKELAAVVNRMLDKDPVERHATPAEVADAVGPFAGGHDLPNLLARSQRKPPITRPSRSLEGTDSSQSSGLTRFLQAIGGRRQPAGEAAPAVRSKLPLILGASGTGLLLLVAAVVAALVIAGRGSNPPVEETTAIAFDWPEDERQGVVLFIDDSSIGVPESGPFSIKCLPGKYRIRASRKGFEPYEERIEVASGTRRKVRPIWIAPSHLVLDWPADQRRDAELSVDGKRPDLAASGNETDDRQIKIVLPAGPHTVRIARRGFEPFEKTVTIAKGGDSYVTLAWSASSDSPEVQITEPEPVATGRLPVPADDVQRPVAERIDAFYKVAEATTPAEKAALAKTILDVAPSKEEPVERYVLLDRAMKLSTDAGDEALLRQAVDALDERYEVDAAELMQTALTTIAEIRQRHADARAAEAVAAGRAEAERLRRQRWTEATASAAEKIAAWDFRGATQSLAQVKFDDEDEEFTARLARRREEVQRMGVLKERMITKINKFASKLKKSDLMLRGVNGQITGADESGITAKLTGGKSESLAWPQLNDKARQRVLQLVVDRSNGDDWLSAGLLALASKDPDFAELLFAQAGSLGIDIGPYLAPLAAAAFARARELIDKQEFDDADAALTSMEEKYAKTPWFASNKTAFDAARAESKAGIVETEAEKLYAEAAKLFKEKQFFDLKPVVEKLKADCPNTSPVTDSGRTPSFAEMEKTVENLGEFIIVRKDGKQDEDGRRVFKTIQAAIDATPPNSLIEIQDDEPFSKYNEKIVISAAGLTLRGKKGGWPVITSVGPTTNFPTLVDVKAPRVTIERLVLAHGGAAGGVGLTALWQPRAGPLLVRSVIIYASEGSACGIRDTDFENCVFLNSICAYESILRNCTLLSSFHHSCRSLRVDNVFCRYGGTFSDQSELRSCTFADKMILKGEPSTFVDCIIESVESTVPKNQIDNCCIYGRPPFIDEAKPGKNCFGADPLFVNPEGHDYRLMPASPCRGKASDGGDLGVRYTPEMLEMLKLAAELRARGIIKF